VKKIIISGLSILALNSSLSAAGHPNTGCGLGSMLIENQSTVLAQVVAVTINGISGNQTFGITSGSVGCSKPAKLALNDQAQKFVADNMDALAIDVAAGEGENLDTFLSLVKVEDKAVASAKLKQDFAKIYSSSDVTSAQVIDNIINSLS
jgi:hypothetical protein